MKKMLKNKNVIIAGIFGIILLILIVLTVIQLFFSSKGNKYGDRLDNIENIKVSDKDLDTIKNTFTNELINEINIRLQGKIIVVHLDFKKDTNITDAIGIAEASLENFSDEIKKNYDLQYFLSNKELDEVVSQMSEEEKNNYKAQYPKVGTKSTMIDKISWTKN